MNHCAYGKQQQSRNHAMGDMERDEMQALKKSLFAGRGFINHIKQSTVFHDF
jgi:hypothetical protein